MRGLIINCPVRHFIKHQHSETIPVQSVNIQILNAHQSLFFRIKAKFLYRCTCKNVLNNSAALCSRKFHHNVVCCGNAFLKFLIFVDMPLQKLFDFSNAVRDFVRLAIFLKEAGNSLTSGL
nr:MAG TPA: hypothetical protein [Caudoviricetes sp.]